MVKPPEIDGDKNVSAETCVAGQVETMRKVSEEMAASTRAGTEKVDLPADDSSTGAIGEGNSDTVQENTGTGSGTQTTDLPPVVKLPEIDGDKTASAE